MNARPYGAQTTIILNFHGNKAFWHGHGILTCMIEFLEDVLIFGGFVDARSLMRSKMVTEEIVFISTIGYTDFRYYSSIASRLGFQSVRYDRYSEFIFFPLLWNDCIYNQISSGIGYKRKCKSYTCQKTKLLLQYYILLSAMPTYCLICNALK